MELLKSKDLDDFVFSTDGELFAVVGKINHSDDVIVRRGFPDLLAGFGVPDFDGEVVGSCCDEFSIWGEVCSVDTAEMSPEYV